MGRNGLDEPVLEEADVNKSFLAGGDKSVAARGSWNSFVGEIFAKECLKVFSDDWQTRWSSLVTLPYTGKIRKIPLSQRPGPKIQELLSWVLTLLIPYDGNKAPFFYISLNLLLFFFSFYFNNWLIITLFWIKLSQLICSKKE